MPPSQEGDNTRYHLITFATDEYVDRARDLLESGRLVGGFDCVCAYSPIHIDNDFKERNAWAFGIMRDRCYGYYIWKPYIMFKHMMEKAAPGDIVCYCDCNYIFIANARCMLAKWTHHNPHIALTQNTPYHQLFTEEDWTKRDAMLLMGVETNCCYECTERFEKSTQLSAGFVCVRKCFKSMSFVSEWLTYSQDRRIITDEDDVVSKRSRPPGYVHNRHDQTVLSLLGKKWCIPYKIFGSGVLHNLRRKSGNPTIDRRARDVMRLIRAKDQRHYTTEGRPGLGMENKWKLAFIMMLTDELPHADAWQTFFAGADPDRVTLYIHQVTPAPLPHGFGCRVVLHAQTLTKLRLCNHLMEHALADDNDNQLFVIVNPWSCAPLRPFNEIYTLAGGSSPQGRKKQQSRFEQCVEISANATCALARDHAQRIVDDNSFLDQPESGPIEEHVYATYLRNAGLSQEVDTDFGLTDRWFGPHH